MYYYHFQPIFDRGWEYFVESTEPTEYYDNDGVLGSRIEAECLAFNKVLELMALSPAV